MEKTMKSKKRLIIKIIASVLAVVVFLVAYYAAVLCFGFFRIEDNLEIQSKGKAGKKAPVGEPLTVLTYNVGFGAYSDDYSFFMDGGEYSRAFSKDAVVDNIEASVELTQSASPDFLFLQEVDIYGTRSHYVDESQMFKDAYRLYDRIEAVNYDSPYLLYPFDEPIGKNKSCIMTFSRYNIKSGMRRSLPIEGFPNNFFDLDRAYTSTRVYTQKDNWLVLYNLHLSAYTSDGKIVDEQLKMLFEDMKKEYEDGNYVVAAGDFNMDLLGDSSKYFERSEGNYTWAQPFNTELIPEGFALFASTNAPSCRNADSAYRGDGTDFVITIDGMIASDNIEVISSETIDTGFAHSDHNPVKFEIILK